MSIRKIMGMVNTTLPFAWDDSLSVYEMLGKLISKINEVVALVNEKLPDDFETTFYERFREYTREEMQRVIDSGEFATILDSMIVEFLPVKQEVIEARDGKVSLGAKIRSVDEQLEENTQEIKDYGIINANSFPKQEGETDDTQRLQRALNFSEGTNGKVNLGNDTYDITGLTVPRGCHLFGGQATLNINGVGNVGLTYKNALYCVLEGVKIVLKNAGQTGIELLTDGVGSKTQLNTFRNVHVEGGSIADTTALKIGLAFVNSYYDCKFFRCTYGVKFLSPDSNANFFYGCEIRHSDTYVNSTVAILHDGGRNNSFQGGVIESSANAIFMNEGSLVLDTVYFESFSSGRAFVLTGGIIKFVGCLIKNHVLIKGGESISFKDCDMSRQGIYTTPNFPFIRFEADVPTKVIMKDNVIKNDLYHSRWGEWADTTTNTWKKRENKNIRESYLDRNEICFGEVQSVSNITGDNVVYDILLNEGSNIYSELNPATGVFSPIDDGLWRFKITLSLEGITDSHDTITLTLNERGSGARSFPLDVKTSDMREYNGRMILKGEVVVANQIGKSLNFKLIVTGSEKTVGIRGGSNSTYSIERLG